ncbi:type 1 periplasmic-binding domain-containing protein [Nonomuraea africana]|uniref:hypothetical protein n=1 Tax=Nonomuraea africana TaxID=46171 RepID=UPI0033DD5AD4
MSAEPTAALTAELTAELTTVVRLASQHHPLLVNVGHGRSAASLERARAFVETWEARGGQVGEVVSWPAEAASWLRPACRMVTGHPDLWVVADEPEGWTGMGRRLVATGVWRPCRTIAFAGLAVPELPALAGEEATEGLRGALADGRMWLVNEGQLVAG